MTYFKDISRKIVECLKVKYGDKLSTIILFGSTVQGRRRLESNLDVIVILTNSMENNRSVRSDLKDIMVEYGMPIDPLIFTVDEFKHMLEQRHPLILGISLGYKAIYDRLGMDGLLSRLEGSLYKDGWRRYK
ncbi:MAG: nucleotidyltransferase domain-containing protein [Candidatus Bathyarchaeia archaeon]